jgi:hypothetical protein
MNIHQCVDGHWCDGQQKDCGICNQKQKHAKVNWSPFATNVLDAGDFALCKPDGTPVMFRRGGMGEFILVIDDKRFETKDNTQMSYWMNQFEIGGVRKP